MNPESIKRKYYNKLIKKVYIKNKGYLKKSFVKGWTIGYDLNNGALFQFTKDSLEKKYYTLNLWVFSYKRSDVPGVNKDNMYRSWINIGWNQGLPWHKGWWGNKIIKIFDKIFENQISKINRIMQERRDEP